MCPYLLHVVVIFDFSFGLFIVGIGFVFHLFFFFLHSLHFFLMSLVSLPPSFSLLFLLMFLASLVSLFSLLFFFSAMIFLFFSLESLFSVLLLSVRVFSSGFLVGFFYFYFSLFSKLFPDTICRYFFVFISIICWGDDCICSLSHSLIIVNHSSHGKIFYF